MTYISAPHPLCWAVGCCRGPRFVGDPHCCGMCTLGAWHSDTPRQAAGCDTRGGPGPGLCRASPAQGTHLSIHPCDLCQHGSDRASGLFPWRGQTLGVMLLGGLGGTALSHFCQGEWVLAARSSIPCRWRWVRLHGFVPCVPSVLRAAPAGGQFPCGGADPFCRDKSWLEGLLWGCLGCFCPKIGCLNSLVAHGTAASRGSSWGRGSDGCRQGSARGVALKKKKGETSSESATGQGHPVPKGVTLGGGEAGSSLGAWKLAAFQERELPAPQSSSLRDASPGRALGALPKPLVMRCWHLTAGGRGPRAGGDAEPGGTEPLGSPGDVFPMVPPSGDGRTL